MKVKYFIDGVDFEQYGVHVSASTGIMGTLQMKKRVEVSWPDGNGKVVDLSAPRFEPREISLCCFIVSTSELLVDKVNNFFQLFLSPGLHQLLIQVNDVVIPYMVYLPNTTNVEKKWNEGQVIGQFELNLIEPEPVKRILKFTDAGTTTVMLSTASPINIYWGDKQCNKDIFGANNGVRHTYEAAGEHYIVVTGNIDDITDFTANATTLWHKLQ